jgi:hypothetical protein
LNLSDKKVAESGSDLGVGNVDHLIVNVEVDLGGRAEVLAGLVRLNVAHLVLEAQQNSLQILRALKI